MCAALQLKRFSYRGRWAWREKLETRVDFPLEGLDLSPWVKGPIEGNKPVYDLYAVSNHFGGMGGGHYTAFCKNKITGKWHTFDDSHVSEMSEDRVCSSSAYVLFYRRRDTIDPAGVDAPDIVVDNEKDAEEGVPADPATDENAEKDDEIASAAGRLAEDGEL